MTKPEAEKALLERIDKGKSIAAAQIQARAQYEEIYEQYRKWDEYNTELLSRMFTGDSIVKEYDQWLRGFLMTGRSFSQEIQEFREDVRKKIVRLESLHERLPLIPLAQEIKYETAKAVAPPPHATIDRNKISIVHGHDDAAKFEVARFIEKLGFTPIILHEQASGSRTIIEKIEYYSDVAFGVVLYTPCDVGGKSSSELKSRARQNVVFEHRFLIGKLQRKNVLALTKGAVETPGDISGVVYTSMDSEQWQLKLAQELRAAGYTIDMNKAV